MLTKRNIVYGGSLFFGFRATQTFDFGTEFGCLASASVMLAYLGLQMMGPQHPHIKVGSILMALSFISGMGYRWGNELPPFGPATPGL